MLPRDRCSTRLALDSGVIVGEGAGHRRRRHPYVTRPGTDHGWPDNGTQGRWRRSGDPALLLRSLLWPAAVAMRAGAAPADATCCRPASARPTVISGLEHADRRCASPPTAASSSPRRRGVVKEFDGLSDPTPRVVRRPADEGAWTTFDRGLLGLAIPPGFPATALDLRRLLARRADRRDRRRSTTTPAPRTSRQLRDGAPRLAHQRRHGRRDRCWSKTGACSTPSHTIGRLAFGPDGSLYVSGGEGADYNGADWGQSGDAAEPVRRSAGAAPAPRSTHADLRGRRAAVAGRAHDGRPDGARRDHHPDRPADGAGSARQPVRGVDGRERASGSSPTACATRGASRSAPRHRTSCGSPKSDGARIEEINRLDAPADATAENFGWPCFEAELAASLSTTADLSSASPLAIRDREAAVLQLPRTTDPVVPGRELPERRRVRRRASAFAPTGESPYPAAYEGALFFGDYSRSCIWVIQRSATSGRPARSGERQGLRRGGLRARRHPGRARWRPVLRRPARRHDPADRLLPVRPPVARITASPASGAAPLAVSFNGSGSNDPDGETLTYQWDFDGNGTFDATGPTASHTYTATGSYTARLRVSDPGGNADTATVTIGVGRPTPVIATPSATTLWSVGQTLGFSGSATDNKGQRSRHPGSAGRSCCCMGAARTTATSTS